MVITTSFKDFFFLKFPILFPIIYGLTLYLYPDLETYIILFAILLLAEPHFGATWPFFLNKVNKDYINVNKPALIFIPLLIVLLCLIAFFLIKNIFLLVFFAANIYHVTRQSAGVGKLVLENLKFQKLQTTIIYIFNFIFFIIGYLRFYLDIGFIDQNLIWFNVFFITIIICSFIIYALICKNLSDTLVLITGCIIFYPICFVENPVHSILMGVTMHYSQYLLLTHKIEKKRSNNENKGSMNFIVKIFIYSIIMTGLSYLSKSNSSFYNWLIIIPITGQMLHFYLDSQLWKFSESHNRENVLLVLKS